MNKIKFFYTDLDDESIKTHQDKINKWFSKNDSIDVQNVQSYYDSDDDITTSILYTNKNITLE